MMQREVACELLAGLPEQIVIELADAVLATPGTECEVLRPPEVGSVVVQVREPVARHRFFLADMMVTSATVRLAGEHGWAMRAGAARQATLAQAICEAELVRRGPLAERIDSVLTREADSRREARSAEWERLRPTTVQFEEVL